MPKVRFGPQILRTHLLGSVALFKTSMCPNQPHGNLSSVGLTFWVNKEKLPRTGFVFCDLRINLLVRYPLHYVKAYNYVKGLHILPKIFPFRSTTILNKLLSVIAAL